MTDKKSTPQNSDHGKLSVHHFQLKIEYALSVESAQAVLDYITPIKQNIEMCPSDDPTMDELQINELDLFSGYLTLIIRTGLETEIPNRYRELYNALTINRLEEIAADKTPEEFLDFLQQLNPLFPESPNKPTIQ